MPRTDAGQSSRVEWIAISIVVVVSAVVFALLLAAEAGFWTWVIVLTALVVVAAVAIGMLISRRRHPPAFDAPRPTRSQAPADGVYRVLVVADESLGNRVVTEETPAARRRRPTRGVRRRAGASLTTRPLDGRRLGARPGGDGISARR